MFGSQQQQQQSSGGLFGSNNQQQQGGGSGGGLFGNSQPAGGGLFGSTSQQSSGGLFGSNSNNTQSGGGLFGANSNTTQSSGGLFGNNNNTSQTSGGLFGNNNTQPATGGGLFGSNNQQQQQSSGGLFGSNNNQSQNGGLFGSNTNTNNQSGGLFGSSKTNTQSGGLFGSSNSTSQSTGLFGNSGTTNQQQPGGLFGNTQQQASNNGGLFGGPSNFNNNQQQYQLQPQQSHAVPWWYRELMSIQNAYRPSQGSRFQTMLYEVIGLAPDLVVHSGTIALSHVHNMKAQRKRTVLQANPWIDERDWQRAEDQNPDPVNWMPSPIIGIDNLYKRVEIQAAHVRMQLEMLTSAPGKQKQITSEPSIEETVESKEDSGSEGQQIWLNLEVGGPEEQIEQCRHGLVRLKHRLIKALGRLERLQSASVRGGRSNTEVEFDQRLGKLETSLSDPRGCKAQLTSIVTQMELEDFRESTLSLSDMQPGVSSSLSSQEQDQQAIFGFLELQREGIDSLMRIVKHDMRDLEIIKRRTSEYAGY